MDSNYSLFNDILNTYACEYTTYFDLNNKCFVLLESSCYGIDDGLIAAPYKEECRFSAWDIFWKSLDAEERALAESFDEKHGFFDFLRETGLIFRYYDAEDKAIMDEMEFWKFENNLDFDWNEVAY